MTETKNLSEKEIWDDSALQNSWNEALQEYNKYHSIHARGEKVEEVLQEFQRKDGDTSGENSFTKKVDMKDVGDVAKDDGGVLAPPLSRSTKQEDSASKANIPEGIPSVPAHLVGAVHDEDLKKLLMSWYYSGYYTGLYEGKQASRNSTT